MNPLTLAQVDATALRELAVQIIKPQGRRHWSEVATLIGRIYTEKFYEMWGYASMEAYAQEELDRSVSDFRSLFKLWLLMADQPEVPPESWARLSRTQAIIIRKLVRMGASAIEWVAAALASPSLAHFRQLASQKLGAKEVWVSFTVKAPLEVVEKLFEPALVLALGEVAPGADAERTRSRDTRFACLEIIMGHYVAHVATVTRVVTPLHSGNGAEA